ncbi:MAG: phosphoglycolate phosphatase, partial [Nevskia sp.]|nr:phosphoglycolate phosphatase [Nevskia sp.]
AATPPETPRFRCRAVLFDLDGTLLDTLPDIAAAVDRTLLGLSLPVAGPLRVRGWVGNGVKLLMERALRHAGADPAATLQPALEAFAAHYAEDYTQRSTLYPGVAATLPALAARGLALAVCTNKPRRFVAPLLDHFGIGSYFSALVSGDTLPRQKPDPAPLLHLAGRLGLPAADCLVVGDSRNDVQAARAAGMAVAAVSYGYNHGEDIRDSHPDAVMATLAELPRLIAQEPGG